MLKTTFYDGLYDENAGCHLAFGRAYAACVEGGAEMSEEQRLEVGLNTSRQHVDLTVGSADLGVTGVGPGGERLEVMRDGRWTPAALDEAGLA